ncbi:MAG: hypothetical protein KJ052_01530 [Candidatus Hydrogenedentes bacterium]|nr:hypothetical protein [Candidatus Hydrogenedentota bacterium]
MSISRSMRLVIAGSFLSLMALSSAFAEEVRDYTCFQVYAPYSPKIDIGSDVAIVYGVGDGFAGRANAWRDQGYVVSMMTGISWGGYGAYYNGPEGFRWDEVQTDKNGKPFMHGNSTDVGYNVPTPDYVEFIKNYIEPALEYGVNAVFLEEPEFWADTGWSEGFKRAWQDFYHEPWQAPDSSPDAQYRASKLKYELYFNALKEVMAHIDARAEEKGITIECHVPTHSLVNYAQWRIVSPESHLIDIPQLDGYIAQVWTGTARTPNVYRGETRERTLETAYLEYGQMLGMTRPTGKKVWFLADPVEDNPNRSWADYKRNYECTVIASLLWPEAWRFEVMPWPDRIFQGNYPQMDMDLKSGERVGIPSEYATEILVVINALNDMKQADVDFDAGTRGIGIIVSDTMMFQRAQPNPSDFGSFYGLALPLLKEGVPLEVVQLENSLYPETLAPYSLLILTYEHQKPLKPEYHEALRDWVHNGGLLLYVGDGSDPYHHVREWWNEEGKTGRGADEALYDALKIDADNPAPQTCGEGCVKVMRQSARDLQHDVEGAGKVRAWVSELLALRGATLDTQNHLVLRRGPYVVANVFEESTSEEPLELHGSLVDLFNPQLPVLDRVTLAPGERGLYCDLAWYDAQEIDAKVIGAGARVRQEKLEQNAFSFVLRGPAGTTANVRVRLPAKPAGIECPVPFEHRWDSDSATLWLTLPNNATDIPVTVTLGS